MATFSPLFSSSSGNSIYIASGGAGLLFDVGRSAKQVRTALADNGLEEGGLQGIFITHEHADHVNGLRVLAKQLKGVPIYATQGTALELTKLLDPGANLLVIPPEGVECGGMFVRPFATSHDSSESCGYTVMTADGRKASICTDLGFVSDSVAQALSGSDLVLLESNHDVAMLESGPYPYYLKKRILSDHGHLSNLACANQAQVLLNEGTTHFFLGHLSKENNLPILAQQTTQSVFDLAGAKENYDYKLQVAPRENEGVKVVF